MINDFMCSTLQISRHLRLSLSLSFTSAFNVVTLITSLSLYHFPFFSFFFVVAENSHQKHCDVDLFVQILLLHRLHLLLGSTKSSTVCFRPSKAGYLFASVDDETNLSPPFEMQHGAEHLRLRNCEPTSNLNARCRNWVVAIFLVYVVLMSLTSCIVILR